VPDRLLRVPIRLRADERSVLYIGYRSTGGTALPLAFETPETAESRRSVGNMAAAAAYAAIAFMIAFGLLQFLALGQPVQLGYATYLAAVLFYLVHMDGWTFQWLWPESPRWNDFAAVPLGLAMSVTALAFSHALLDVAAMSTRLSRVFKAAMALAVGMALVAPLGQPAWFKSAAYGVTLLGAVLCAAAGLLAWRRRVPAVRFYVIGWVGVAAGVALTALASNLPALVPKEMADLLPKLTIVFDALMFSMALADRASALRRERDQTAQRELAALRLQHETAERLHATERERLEAQLLAQAKARQLATASHDIRQPLASLKLTLAALGDRGEISAHVQERFSHSIDYLEQLAREYTAAGAPTAGGGAHAAHGEAAAPGPGFALDMLIDNLALMFRAEAEGKGLALDARRTRATAGVQVRGDAMAAMRVAGNLVANAIRYTEAGRVLITARCRGDRVVMGVHDTGPGIAAGELAQLFDEGRRGAAAEGTEGSGLGLSIASRLAEREGFGLRVRSRVGRGSCFQVEMPRRVFVARGEDRRRRRP
jgi:signal transduction histidine kinase